MSERVARDRPIGMKILAVVGLIALVLGIGMSQSFDLFRLGNASYGAGATPQGFSDFVTLAKKLGPVVVNVSSTRVRGRGRELFGPFGEEDTGDELFGVPDPGVVFASEASVRGLSSTAMARS